MLWLFITTNSLYSQTAQSGGGTGSTQSGGSGGSAGQGGGTGGGQSSGGSGNSSGGTGGGGQTSGGSGNNSSGSGMAGSGGTSGGQNTGGGSSGNSGNNGGSQGGNPGGTTGESGSGAAGGEQSGGSESQSGNGETGNNQTPSGEGTGENAEGNAGENEGEGAGTDDDKVDKSIVTGEGAIEAVQNGTNLCYVTTEALKAGIEACGEQESMAEIKGIMQAEVRLREMIGEYKDKALVAEDIAAECMKDYVEQLAALEKLENDLKQQYEDMFNTHRDTTYSDYIQGMEDLQKLKETQDRIKEQKEKVEESKEKLEEAVEQMEDAYQELSDVMNEVGDPVRLSTGKYVAEYTDYTAIDYVTNFKITRNFENDGCVESFGKNWTCSLDSRISRCIADDFSVFTDTISEIIEMAKDEYETLNLVYVYFPDYENEELNEKISVIESYIKNYESLLAYYNKLTMQYFLGIITNRKVMYGKFLKWNNIQGTEDMIQYLDKNGRNRTFLLNEQGFWEPLTPLAKNEVKIYGRNMKDEISNTGASLMGYIVEYSDGRKIYYDTTGVLEKEIDRNGNETLYFAEGQNRINRIELCTGETILIERNSENLITSIKGNYSGNSYFTYEDNYLSSVMDNEGVRVTYTYDADGDLIKIGKADGKKVNISYDLIGEEKRCVSVTNENGDKEYFEYNLDKKTVKHKTVSGAIEEYKYNSNGNTVYIKDEQGIETTIKTNSDGMIKSIIKNGITTEYRYDENHRIKNKYHNGGNTVFYYNPSGDYEGSKDPDDFTTSYAYDRYGNVISISYCKNLVTTLNYDSRGLVTKLQEKGNIYNYEYNSYGQLLKKTSKFYDGKTLTENWKYNEKGQTSSYENSAGEKVNFSYQMEEDRLITKTENYNGRKEVKYYYDERLRQIKTEIKDLKNKVTHTKTCVYDGMGNITKLYMDDGLLSQYEYTKDGKIKSYIVWNNIGKEKYITLQQGIKTDYEFDAKGFMTKESRNCINSKNENQKVLISSEEMTVRNISYVKNTNEMIVNNYGGSDKKNNPDQYFYNLDGKLTKIKMKDGYEKLYEYSKGGRLIRISDTNGNHTDYRYRTDGYCEVADTKVTGKTIVSIYDESGRLVSEVDGKGNEKQIRYDSAGNVIQKSNAFMTYYYSYDMKNRPLSEIIKDKNGKKIYEKIFVYDDVNGAVKEKINNGFEVVKYYDVWNRLIKVEHQYGGETYRYDVLGKLREKKLRDGTSYKYEYTAFGKLGYASSTKGEELCIKYDVLRNCLSKEKNKSLIYQGKYDKYGRLIKSINDKGAESTYEYDKNDVLSSFENYDTGKILYKINTGEYGKEIVVTNPLGNAFTYCIGSNGLVESEIDSMGRIQIYKYDSEGRLIHKSRFSGLKEYYSYDNAKRETTINYSNGDIFESAKNLFNQYTKLSYNENDLRLEYDLNGLLTKTENKSADFIVDYSYDDRGRCTRKKSNDFDIQYSYDVRGNIQKIQENKSGENIKFFYDNLNREIKRVYLDGTIVESGYERNLKTYEILKGKNGEIIHGDFILYDSTGKIQVQVNEKGQFKKYYYDSKGRLIETACAYKDEILENAYAEAINNGFYVKDTMPAGTLINLTETELNSLNNILKTAKVESKIRVPKTQYSWVEKYEYNAAGSLKVYENSYGKILYEYDEMNRLIKKYGNTSKNESWYYLWNDDGNLIEAGCKINKLHFEYNAVNKLTHITDENLLTGKTDCVEYRYDGAGRRIQEIVNDYIQIMYIYDGLTNRVLYKYPMTINKTNHSNYVQKKVLNYDSENRSSVRDNKDTLTQSIEEDYRIFQNDKVSEFGESRTLQIGTEKDNFYFKQLEVLKRKEDTKIESDMRPSIYLYANNVRLEAIQKDVYGGVDGYNALVFINDFKGNNCGILKQNQVMEKTSFGTWGNFYEFSNDITFNYGQLIFYGAITIFDLGNRAYCPDMKSFISMDPARQDGNWFAYCATDPVNYQDATGLYKKSTKPSQDAGYTSALAEFILFDGENQKNNGSEMGIPLPFDCADTTAAIDNICAHDAGMEDYSPMADDFDSDYTEGDLPAAREDTKSDDYWDGDGTDTTQVSDDICDLQDPTVTTPGTIIVTAPDEGKNVRTGHTIMVVARDFDENGNVVGIVYIEGHMGDGTSAETGYMYVNNQWETDKNLWNIRAWRGKYSGTYELEGSEANKRGEDADPNYRCEK